MFYLICPESKDPCSDRLRSGVLPLKAQTGRCINLEDEKQICPMGCLNDDEWVSFCFLFL